MKPCADVVLVDRHFERGLPLPIERRMREHLPGCASCRDRYDRQLLRARLDPQARSAKERLGVPLGLWAPERLPLLALPWVRLAAVSACVVAMLAGGVALRQRHPAASFAARGGGEGASGVEIFRASSTAVVAAGAAITSGEELAFRYRAEPGRRYLMIFGVDEHRHVYWYYPAWTDPAARPSSVVVADDGAVHALPDAIHHRLDGERLRLQAVFTAEPWTVDRMEARVQELPDPLAPLVVEGGRTQSQLLWVHP